MTKSKTEILSQLKTLTGSIDPAWESMPVYKLLVELEKHRPTTTQVPDEDDVPDFRSKIHGNFR